MINEQKRCLMAPIGEALLSTPAPDRDERDEERLKQCRELNKVSNLPYFFTQPTSSASPAPGWGYSPRKFFKDGKIREDSFLQFQKFNLD
jgi:hypothetical protein